MTNQTADVCYRAECSASAHYGIRSHSMDLPVATQGPTGQGSTNGAGIDRRKLTQSTGRPKGARNLNAKHPSSIARAFKKAGLDWQRDFADAIKGNKRERIKLWLRLLPYLITTTNKIKVRKWKGKASKAALIALETLEGR